MPKDSSIQYLDQKVFEPFLLTKAANKIQKWTGSLNCDDCRNYWMKKNPSLFKKFVNPQCSNEYAVDNPENFKKCSS